MIKAVASKNDGGSAVFLGLSRLNTEKLLDNQPIIVRLRELDPKLPDLDIILLGGETEDDIAEDLRTLGGKQP